MRGVLIFRGVINKNALRVELRRGALSKWLIHLRHFILILLKNGFLSWIECPLYTESCKFNIDHSNYCYRSD